MPVAVPGAALSPGISNRNLAKAAALTLSAGLVLEVITGLVISDAVTVALLPAVFSVRLNALLPAIRAVFAGRLAFASELERLIVSVTVEATFQNASTALMVTLKDVPAVCDDTAPVLPLTVAGAEISPGTRSWSFATAPGLMTMFEEEIPVRPALENAMEMLVARLCARSV